MIRLGSQFDEPRRRSAVATPSCCCCCCLVTTLTSATLTAVHVDGTAVRNFVHGPRRKAITVAAAISVPVAGIASVLLAVPLFSWGGEGVTWPMLAIAAGAGVILLVCYCMAGDLLGATRNASLVVLVTMAFFGIELLTIGWLLYGQFLAVPVAIVAGICLYHRMQRAT